MKIDSDLIRIQGGEGSKFNSALADLERIHLLLVDCNRASRIGELRLWLYSLHSLERELCVYLNEDENKELNDVRVDDIPPDRKYWGNFQRKLDDYERKLRHYRAKKKLGIVAQDDATNAALR